MTNQKMGTLYIGATDNLKNRIEEHKSGFYRNSFTNRHRLEVLVYYEKHDSIYKAMKREQQLNKWNRDWKLRLIIEQNPDWRDLSNLL